MRFNFLKACAVLAIASGLLWTAVPSQSALANTPAQSQLEGTVIAQAAEAKLPRLNGKATVELTVNGKTITVELDGTNAPLTAGNFVDLVQRGVYNGTMFHRVIQKPDPFVAQGGDPQSKDPKVPSNRLGTGGFIDPKSGAERNVPLEIKKIGDKEPTYGRTFRDRNKLALTHKRGAIAMARSQQPNSASSQFYFALADLAFLDGSYAVFGYVTQGMEVVDGIKQGDRITSAKVISGAENLK
jgi:peptidyl-prolyl cis-trans isomerase B (cyclophilin B)